MLSVRIFCIVFIFKSHYSFVVCIVKTLIIVLVRWYNNYFIDYITELYQILAYYMYGKNFANDG